jgi:hypothetical protein
MKRYFLAMILGVAALSLGGCSDAKKKPGCAKDTDCKGERVCQKSTCVSPTASSEESGKVGKGKAPKGLMAALNIARPKATGPGGGATGPGAGPGPGGTGTWKKDSIRICLGPRCVGLGRGFGSNSKDMRAMLDMLKQLLFSGLGGMGQIPKLKVCVGPQCVKVDKTLLKNPMAMIKLFSNLNPQMLRDLFKSTLGRLRGSPGRNPRTTPGIRPHRTGPGPSPKTAPQGNKAFRTFAAMLQAGDKAIGRTAELAKMTITSVSDNRLVLEGPAGEMIVLRIGANLKALLPKLRITTTKVVVRFRVLSRAIGKLVHGELLSYD